MADRFRPRATQLEDLFSNVILYRHEFSVTYNQTQMKAYVHVALKKSVLDPQGKTIHSALQKMGYKGLTDVRQGKYFELDLDNSLSPSDAEAEVARIAREVLTNPVIEDFRFTLEPASAKL